MGQIDFTLDAQQGPLPGGFHIDLEGDYIVLVGANNAAKSSILQAIFKKFFNRVNSRGKFDACLILPERIFIETTTQTGSRTLEGYNLDLQSTISGNANRSYNATNIGPQSSELPKLLLNHWNFVQQYHRINSYLQHFGLPQFILDGPQEIKFEDVQVSV